MFEEAIPWFRDKSNFMEIVPPSMFEAFVMRHRELENMTSGFPLRVIQSKGVDVEKDFDITVTDLNTGDANAKYKHFYNTGSGGITFKVDVAVNPRSNWGYGEEGERGEFGYHGKPYWLRKEAHLWLNKWFVEMTPLYVVTDAWDVPNGMYIISSNPKRKQDFRYYTVWTLEFTTYRDLGIVVYNNYLTQKNGQSTAPAKPVNTELSNCQMNAFQYSPNEKITGMCTVWLRDKLFELGYLGGRYTYSGWYNQECADAVKKFQEDYVEIFPDIKVTGMMDEATLKAITTTI